MKIDYNFGKKSAIFLLSLFLVIFYSAVKGQIIASRCRPVISDGTLKTDQGSIMRGVNTWSNKWTIEGTRSENYLLTQSYYDQLKALNINLIRVCATDAFQRRNGWEGWNWSYPGDLAAAFSFYDKAFEMAAINGIYVCLNYHDIGNFNKTDIRSFWTGMATRYKDWPNVFFEIINEPSGANTCSGCSTTGGWFPEDYDNNDNELLVFEKEIYDLVRRLAPETHIVMFSFPNINGFSTSTMLSVVNQFNSLFPSFNWSTANASIGFHPYYTSKSSANIMELKNAGYPVFNTEMNLTSHENTVPMDDEDWGSETMERLGISWIGWHTEGEVNVEVNFKNGYKADAVSKGYFWPADIYNRLPCHFIKDK